MLVALIHRDLLDPRYRSQRVFHLLSVGGGTGFHDVHIGFSTFPEIQYPVDQLGLSEQPPNLRFQLVQRPTFHVVGDAQNTFQLTFDAEIEVVKNQDHDGDKRSHRYCRQILQQTPRRLVCLDLSEAALYEIDRELSSLVKNLGSDCEIVALLGSVHHEARMQEAISVFGIQTLYHAAAYKHVPIVEQNVFEGIHNNVFGTWRTAQAAAQAGVESFVLISTDKAVNPTSVMGATKRMAELVLQAINQESRAMRVSMVRFGIVLESSGSVVPLFKEQIRNGGPVTITHKDIIRYFMTIPEAAQLVIQAGAMAQGGDVFVLDMGDPIRIEDLARRMINLMGLTVQDESNPSGDIEIEYVGLRPAEKLFEELLIGSNTSGTGHSRILRADEEFLSIDELTEILEELLEASSRLDYGRARDLVMRAVKEYRPTYGIGDHLWVGKTGTDGDRNENVVPFPHHT